MNPIHAMDMKKDTRYHLRQYSFSPHGGIVILNAAYHGTLSAHRGYSFRSSGGVNGDPSSSPSPSPSFSSPPSFVSSPPEDAPSSSLCAATLALSSAAFDFAWSAAAARAASARYARM